MTRQEFIDEVTSWEALIDFCDDNGFSFCEDVYSEECYDETIHDKMEDKAYEDTWQELRDWLSGLPEGYDYYIQDSYGNWSEADDDDFDSIKDNVIEYMDDEHLWDDNEETEEEAEEYIDPEDEIPVEDENVSFAELFTVCSGQVQKIEEDRNAALADAEQAEVTAFNEFCIEVGIITTIKGSDTQ